MKAKLITNIFSIFLILSLLASFGGLHAQTKPQNIYRVAVSSWYKIEDGQRTAKYFTLSQHISDSLGRLHTEIYWDRNTQNPGDVQWHFFSGNIKMKTHFLTTEGVYRVEKYAYNAAGLIEKIMYLPVVAGDTLLAQSQTLKYNPQGTLLKTEGFNAKGKRGYVATHRFDSNNTEIERKVKGKKLIPIDSVLTLLRVPQYDSTGRLIHEYVKLSKEGGRNEQYNKSYQYNEKGLLVGQSLFDGNGALIKKFEYTYRKDGRLWQEFKYNTNGDLIDFVAWRYEIYTTNDRKIRVLE